MDDLSSDGSLPSLDSPQPPEDDVEKDFSAFPFTITESTEPPTKSQSAQNLAPSECAICGGPANGYHYEAPSCNSCKTFFRRVMLRGRLPMCKKLNGKEECPQRKNGRAVCRGCRFERCISAGMDCRVIESATGAHRSNQLFKLVMKRQGRQIKEEEKQEVEKEDIHEQPSTSNALVHVSTPLSTEADHFKTLVFLKTMDSDLRSRIEGPDGLVPLPSQSLAAYIMGGQYSKKTMAKTIDEAQSFMGSFACTHYLIEYERASQMCSRFPFYEKLGSQDKLSLFQFAAFASKLATLAYRAKCVKSPSILLRDGSFPPILPHNPWGFHELIFYRPVSLWSDADVDDDEFLLLRALLLCSTPADLPEFAMKELEKTKLRFARTLFAYEATKLGPTKGAERFQLLLSTLNSWILLTAKHKELYVMGRYRALKRGPPESLFPAYVDPLVVELMSG